MKKRFIEPEIQVFYFSCEDVLTSSGSWNKDIETEIIPEGAYGF